MLHYFQQKHNWLNFGPEYLFMGSTFKDIVASLPLLLSDNIALRLGCAVSRKANSGIGVINVEAADGFRSVFDDVVVTAPLGWLKRS